MDGLTGLMPLCCFFVAAAWLFAKSEWAMENPALAVAMLTPGYSLINSKLIVCNFTKMQNETVATHFFFITFFQLNKDHMGGFMNDS